MQNLKVTINLGLENNPIPLDNIIKIELPDRYRIVESEYKGRPERTLVMQWDVNSEGTVAFDAILKVRSMLKLCSQESIPLHIERSGGLLIWSDLVPLRDRFEFDHKYFKFIYDEQ